MEPQVRHAQQWLRRHALFDEYCDLVLRGLCSLGDALDSYLWELGYGIEERRRIIAELTWPAADDPEPRTG